MNTHAEVVVIGGGVVGCSVLYHLAKNGCRDALLIERDELTSGSSWHAAGGMHMLNGNPDIAGLQKYTMEVMSEIEELSGQNCSVHVTGNILFASSESRLDWLKMVVARARYHGVEHRIISPAEAAELMPLADPSYFVGAMHDQVTAHVDPAGTTRAYAKAAQALGARVKLRNRVVDTVQRENGDWDVVTEEGAIRAGHVVNAAGLWAREVGRMAGLELPVLAMEHHYILTEAMPEVIEHRERTGRELMHATDFSGELYMRQERDGMLLGTYEKACVPWSEQETPWDFGPELLQPDFDRITPSLEIGFEHFPAFSRAGIREAINGPFTFAPDGNPLVGPVRGLRNYWCACGVMAGFSQGGGVGFALANWILDGDPGADVWGMDVARYGDWSTMAYTNAKVRENYARRFEISFPNEELPAGRPLRTTPIYDRLLAKGAVMGDASGLEVPLWYAPEGVEDVLSFRRSTDFEHVAAECRAVRKSVGISEISGFAKYEVAGEGAREWLDHILAGRMPKSGRMSLTPMLNEQGKLIGDFTTANLNDSVFFLVGSGAAEDYHMRWFFEQEPAKEGASVRALGLATVGLAIAGPRSGDVLAALTPMDVSGKAFRFLDIREMDVGVVPCRVGRVSYTGDLGYEIWCPAEFQLRLYEQLLEAGEEFGIRHFGGRALNGLRLEKGFGSWVTEYRPVYGPLEAGMDRFVSYEKNVDFIGREAARAERESGGSVRLCTFAVETEDIDVLGDEPIWLDGEIRGRVTSGGYAHESGKSIALGYVPKAFVNRTEGWEIEILADRCSARLFSEPLFDPRGEKMRA